MSNNKQIMKLYTEEQLEIAMAYVHAYHESDTRLEDEEILKKLTPLELPSDEEIDAHVEEDFLNSTEVHKYSEEVQLLMKAMCKAGMQCMRDKIQGGNK